jgi:prolipoprotein diacylglyceryltransferase
MFVLPVIPFPAINPILISIGPFAMRWYALAYIVGIIAGWFYARAIIARNGCGADRRLSPCSTSTIS